MMEMQEDGDAVLLISEIRNRTALINYETARVTITNDINGVVIAEYDLFKPWEE